MMKATLLLASFAATVVLAACSPSTADARIGTPRPARDASCDLVVVNGSEPATMTKYEAIGIVRLQNAPAGTGPLDPSVRTLVRPRACALGGEAVSVMASGDQFSRNGLRETAFASYIVWAKKTSSSAPQKF